MTIKITSTHVNLEHFSLKTLFKALFHAPNKNSYYQPT